jgi:hypothetical protein
MQFGITQPEFIKMVAIHPSILGLSVSKIKHNRSFFMEKFQLAPDQLKAMILRHPLLLNHSVEAKLVPTTEFFIKEVGISVEKVAGVIISYPRLYGLSVEKNLRPKFLYFTNHLEISPTAIAEQTVKTPSLFGYSLAGRIVPRHLFLMSMKKFNPESKKSILENLKLMLTDSAFCKKIGCDRNDYDSFCSDLHKNLTMNPTE